MYFSEVKAVEKRDAVLTKEQQIERLTKPGSKYGNLNPFAVLMVGYDADENTTRKSFRKLSILTHPDKNPDQKVRNLDIDIELKRYLHGILPVGIGTASI